MKDKTLLNLALISGIIGVVSLFLIMHFSPVKEYNIQELSNETDGKSVKISGTIQRVTNTEKTTFIEIAQTCSITGIIFENITLQKGEKVQVTGKLSEYNGKKEILVDEIKK